MTITIAENDTPISFHLSHKSVLFYNGNHLKNEKFESQLKNSLIDYIQKPDESDSPVLMAMGGRGTLYGIIHKDENERRTNALVSELRKNDFLINNTFENYTKNQEIRSQKNRF